MNWTVLVQRPKTASWATPRQLYRDLHAEFAFTYDPCPLDAAGGLYGTHDGLLSSWGGQRVFCNPPYGPGVVAWLARHAEADLAVYLLPARTDSSWFAAYAPRADEVRFIRGRLKFGDARHAAPFASLIMIFTGGGIGGGH